MIVREPGRPLALRQPRGTSNKNHIRRGETEPKKGERWSRSERKIHNNKIKSGVRETGRERNGKQKTKIGDGGTNQVNDGADSINEPKDAQGRGMPEVYIVRELRHPTEPLTKAFMIFSFSISGQRAGEKKTKNGKEEEKYSGTQHTHTHTLDLFAAFMCSNVGHRIRDALLLLLPPLLLLLLLCCFVVKP